MTSSFLSDTLGIPWNGGSVLPGSMPTMGQGGSYFSHNTAVIPYPTNSINTFTGGGKRTRRIRKAISAHYANANQISGQATSANIAKFYKIQKVEL